MGNATPRPLYPPGKEGRYPLYRRLGGPRDRCGRVRKISLPPGFDTRTVQLNFLLTTRNTNRSNLSYPCILVGCLQLHCGVSVYNLRITIQTVEVAQRSWGTTKEVRDKWMSATRAGPFLILRSEKRHPDRDGSFERIKIVVVHRQTGVFLQFENRAKCQKFLTSIIYTIQNISLVPRLRLMLWYYTWSLTVNHKHRLNVFGNVTLRKSSSKLCCCCHRKWAFVEAADKF